MKKLLYAVLAIAGLGAAVYGARNTKPVQSVLGNERVRNALGQVDTATAPARSYCSQKAGTGYRSVTRRVPVLRGRPVTTKNLTATGTPTTVDA